MTTLRNCRAARSRGTASSVARGLRRGIDRGSRRPLAEHAGKERGRHVGDELIGVHVGFARAVADQTARLERDVRKVRLWGTVEAMRLHNPESRRERRSETV